MQVGKIKTERIGFRQVKLKPAANLFWIESMNLY